MLLAGFPHSLTTHCIVPVVTGFYNLWTNSVLQTNLTAAAQELMVKHRTPRLFVTGHSMGGALATLCALDLKFKLNFTEVTAEKCLDIAEKQSIEHEAHLPAYTCTGQLEPKLAWGCITSVSLAPCPAPG
jgi:hypothetical protein